MKKVLLSLLLILTILLTGCFGDANSIFGNSVNPNQDKIVFTIEDDFASFLVGDEIPTFTFEFDGNLNTVKNVNKKFYTSFTKNEDKILSDALTNLFEKYKDNIYFDTIGSDEVQTTLFSTLDQYGNVVNVEYEPDDKKVYEETAYISLENGLKLTVDYRRFTYNGKTYYSWKYTAAITMYLYYPCMVIEGAEGSLTNNLVLISLPNRVTFKVGPNQRLDTLINSKTYIDDEDCIYYTFNYLESDDKDVTLTLDQKQQYVIDYYINEMNGSYDENTKTISYSYLGNNFTVELLENNFKMHYVK